MQGMRKVILMGVCLGFGTLSSAFSLSTATPYTNIDLGWSQLDLGTPSSAYNYYGGFSDTYQTKNSASKLALGLGAGYEFPAINQGPRWAIGFGVYNTLSGYGFNGSANVGQTAGASGTLYTNSFTVRSLRLMLEGQALWQWHQYFEPYINLGLGSAWNTLSGYSETTLQTQTPTMAPVFEARTTLNLAYQIGVGLGYRFAFSHGGALNNKIALGYQYVNLGSASFKNRNDTTSGDYYALSVGPLSTQNVYLRYTHLFGA